MSAQKSYLNAVNTGKENDFTNTEYSIQLKILNNVP